MKVPSNLTSQNMELIVLHTLPNCIFYYEYIFVLVKLNVKKKSPSDSW